MAQGGGTCRAVRTWNLHQAFWATRASLPWMIERRCGRIVNIASVAAKVVRTPGNGHYATFKHALVGFTKAVALEYGPVGVTSNAICSGTIETDLLRESGVAVAADRGLS